MSKNQEYHYKWSWDLKSSPEKLWPLIANTNRFNRDAGLPSVEHLTNNTLKNARRRVRFSRLGVTVAWEEEPFQWIEPHCFGIIRRYSQGPIDEMRVAVNLIPQSDGGTQLIYQIWVTPKNILGKLAIPIQIGKATAQSFAAVFQSYDKQASGQQEVMGLTSRMQKVKFSPGGEKRLNQLHQELISLGASPHLLTPLIDLITSADDLTVSHLRPYELADILNVPRRPVLNLYLLATRVGLLEFEWDLLCPLCRGAKAKSQSLSNIEPEVHCDTCNIDFEVSFDRSVELTFHPNPSIRAVEIKEYCIAGPRVTPHVIAQQLLMPKESRTLDLKLSAGSYRLRALQKRGALFLTVDHEGKTEQTAHLNEKGWTEKEIHLIPNPTLHIQNDSPDEQLFILEHMALNRQAATAAEVTALQEFRDLFSEEALRPGERISVGSLAVVFTDLYGSTEFYNQIGDATAFGHILNHFDVLKEIIKKENGALVKTMGDAVFAVFQRPLSALKTIIEAQEVLKTKSDVMFRLKAGIHYGPCIAVTLNDHLDYFGSTINIAARLEKLSTGGDIIISETMYNDPEINEFLTQKQTDFVIEPIETTLKGFDEKRFSLKRVQKAPPNPTL